MLRNDMFDKNKPIGEHREYADVAVLGGGVSGVSTAILIKEEDPSLDVLIVDKVAASKGFAGKGPRTAGLISFVTQEDDPEAFVKFFVENLGMHISDQVMCRDFAYKSRMIVEALERWGVKVSRDENHKLDAVHWPFPFGTASIHPDLVYQMVQHAKKLGVRFLDRIYLSDLLKSGNRVCGACGFNVDDGTFNIITAATVVLATGSQNYDAPCQWPHTGIGIAASYRAGAQMRNAEFGCMSDFGRYDPEKGLYYFGCNSGAHTAHDNLYNKLGENISQKYRPGLHTSNDPSIFDVWYKETMKGNGPITAHLKEFYEGGGGEFFKFDPEAFRRYMRQHQIADYPFDTQEFEVVPGFQGELTCVRVNHAAMTTLPGLYAVGDVSYHGSARTGAGIHIHGTGLMQALFMAYQCAPSVVCTARTIMGTGLAPDCKEEDLAALKEKTYAPLYKEEGMDPRDLIHEMQDAMFPVDYSVIKSEEKMNEALAKVKAVQAKLGDIKANDLRDLTKCIDVQSMAICGEIFYRASLERKDTRGWNYRTDYPQMDDENFLKWIILQNVDGEMKVTLEDLPMDTYPYQFTSK